MGRDTLFFSGLILSLSIISLTFEYSSVYERPTQSSIVSLYLCGISILLLRISFPSIFSISNSHLSQPPIQSRNQNFRRFPRNSSPQSLGKSQPLTPRVSSLLIATLVFALCFRIEIYRLALGSRQCTISGVEGLLPFSFALYENFHLVPWRYSSEDYTKSVLSGVRSRRHARYLVPAVNISIASVITAIATDGVRSTYICPHFSVYWRIIPLLQILGTFLDVYVLICIDTLIRRKRNDVSSGNPAVPLLISSVYLLSATFLSLGGIVAFITHPRYWKWIFGIDITYIYGLIWHTSLFTVASVCVSNIYLKYGLLHLSVIVTFVCAYLSGFKDYLLHKDYFMEESRYLSVAGVIFLFLGAAQFLHSNSQNTVVTPKRRKRRYPRILSSPYSLLALLFILRFTVQLPSSIVVKHHPIDLLRQAAIDQSQKWLAEATISKTLAESAETYRQKYQRHPPPGFDDWYYFALNRSTVIIDDYDNIYEDLQLFWAVRPTDIRIRTREILSDQWNEVAEINIRSGKAEIGPRVRPTHRWMLSGILEMLKSFVQWLPDMDLAFNINDEPRIAVPWESLQKLRKASISKGIRHDSISSRWSVNRAQTWLALDKVVTSKRCFKDRSSMNSFIKYGSIACPPDSPARKLYTWDPRNLCFSCAAPHSLGLFLSNWSLSASPCHQPDLAHLHGFYLSPGAFRPSQDLLPVFSQSKAYGYADIRYPSAWNYIDKVKYEPSNIYPDEEFADKKNVLFWRGATSEGLSKHAAWKGMARQRLVHLANNATHPLPILLPHPSQPGSYANNLLSPTSISAIGLHLDMGIVDLITRCWDWDCENQVAEFGLMNKTDFQAHWGYRYLFDLDGTAFSGRFLPFLQSRSLVFKTAIFREWWDGRLFAWKHFIPIDVRFHGLLSTLAYFAGTTTGESEGPASRRYPPMQEHLEAGEQIATEGREWAAKVLRKEDMEVYMFRLLLEWGRLTDDRRDELGYLG